MAVVSLSLLQTSIHLLSTPLVDLVGARVGYSIAFVIWTIGHTLCGFVYTAFQFSVARFVLGIGEFGNFLAGIKAVMEPWAGRPYRR